MLRKILCRKVNRRNDLGTPGFYGTENIRTNFDTAWDSDVLTSSGSGQCPAMVPSDHISEHSISKGGVYN
jgi:hypothetical protein